MNPEEARSVDELLSAVNPERETKYVFFWGHNPKVPGQIDQSCLSNWYPAKFVVDGIEYQTTEHFMMAEKARLFGDSDILDSIIHAKNPGAAKALGRKVSDFNEDVWLENRFSIVVSGNLEKFSQNELLSEYLLKTGTKVLVEASPRDRIWGIGMGKNNENATNPALWRGLNLLGFALMEVRSKLQGKA